MSSLELIMVESFQEPASNVSPSTTPDSQKQKPDATEVNVAEEAPFEPHVELNLETEEREPRTWMFDDSIPLSSPGFALEPAQRNMENATGSSAPVGENSTIRIATTEANVTTTSHEGVPSEEPHEGLTLDAELAHPNYPDEWKSIEPRKAAFKPLPDGWRNSGHFYGYGWPMERTKWDAILVDNGRTKPLIDAQTLSDMSILLSEEAQYAAEYFMFISAESKVTAGQKVRFLAIASTYSERQFCVRRPCVQVMEKLCQILGKSPEWYREFEPKKHTMFRGFQRY